MKHLILAFVVYFVASNPIMTQVNTSHGTILAAPAVDDQPIMLCVATHEEKIQAYPVLPGCHPAIARPIPRELY